MKLKDWLKNEKTHKTNIPDGVSVAYDLDGTPLGEVEYKNGYLIRRTEYPRRKSMNIKSVDLDIVDLNNKGRSLGNIGKHKEALKYFNKALKANPKYESAWHNKALMILMVSH